MSKSLTEAAKAVLEGKSQIEEGIYPEVSPGKISNPNPVDPSTASTGNAKTLKPKSKASEDRHSQNGAGASGTEDFPLPQYLGGATPTSTAKENLGAKASTSKDTTRSSKANVAGEKMKRMGSQPAMAEEMEDEGEVVEEENTPTLAERLKAIKEAKKMEKNDDHDDEDDKDDEDEDEDKMKKCDEEFELSEELEDFINEGIAAGLSEEEILAAIDENFDFISEEEELDESINDLARKSLQAMADKAGTGAFFSGGRPKSSLTTNELSKSALKDMASKAGESSYKKKKKLKEE